MGKFQTQAENNKKHLIRLLVSGPVELRCFDRKSDMAQRRGDMLIWTSVFSDIGSMVQAIRFSENMGMDVYHTINPLALPVTNSKLQPYQKAARDSDVSEIKTLFFDFDPVRETGTAATDEQSTLAVSQAVLCSEYLDDEGWGIPTFGFSGNGAHLLYALSGGLLNNAETKKLLAGLYEALDKRFGTDQVAFDRTVRNPARIARCLGTTNRKAERRSSCIYSDGTVTAEMVTALADKITPPPKKRTWVQPPGKHDNLPGLSGVNLLDKFAGRILGEPEPGKYWVECPNIGQHGETGKTDSVLWFDGRYYTYHCSHAHCAELTAKVVASML